MKMHITVVQNQLKYKVRNWMICAFFSLKEVSNFNFHYRNNIKLNFKW